MHQSRIARLAVGLSAFALIFSLLAGLPSGARAQASVPDASATLLEWTATGPDGALVTLDGSNSSADFNAFAWWKDCAALPCDGGTRLTDDGASSTAQVLLAIGDHSVTLFGHTDAAGWAAAPTIVVTVLPETAPIETEPTTETATEPAEATETATQAAEPTVAVDISEAATPTEEFSLAAIPACGSNISVVTTDLSTWNLGDTRSAGHNELVAGGLHVWTESNTSEDKAAGYLTTDFPLSQAGVPGIEFASYTGGRPSLQIRLDVTGDGTWDGTLVYEPWAYGEGNYWSNYDFGVGAGLGYNSFGTLDDYLEANPTAQVTMIGYSLGSGLQGDAVITSLTVGCVEYTFDVPPACPAYTTVVTTDLATWDLSQTRSLGHNELVAGGLHVWTESGTPEDKAAGYIAASFPLAAAGEPGIEFATYTGGRPSLQLAVDKDNDGGFDGYLVYEPWAYGDGNFWSNHDFGIGGGLGYTSFGTLADYVAVNPDAQVVAIGYSLGSGLLGDAVITSLTAGCVIYTFDAPPPRPRIFVTPNPVAPGQTATVDITDFDASDSVLIRWRVNGSWVAVGTVATDANGAGSTQITVPTNAAAGLNSVRGDGDTKAQQTNAVMVTGQGPMDVELSKLRATVNSHIGFTVENVAPGATVTITWRRPGGSTVNLGTATADAFGVATGTFKIPATEGGDGNRVIFAAGTETASVTFEVAPRIKVIPGTVSAGQTVDVSLRGYGKGETVRIRWRVDGSWVTVATVTTSNTGSANIDVVVPANADEGQNSVRGDGPLFRQQTNAVTVVAVP